MAEPSDDRTETHASEKIGAARASEVDRLMALA
jgi:hypothetical protein